MKGWEDVPPGITNLLSLYAMLGEKDTADSLASILLQRFPEDPRVIEYEYSTVGSRRRSAACAANLVTFLERYPNTDRAPAARGKLLALYSRELDDTEKARARVRSSLPIDTEDLFAYACRLMEEEGEPGEAEAILRRCMAELEDDGDSRPGRFSPYEWMKRKEEEGASCRRRLASLFGRRGETEEAAALLEGIVAETPDQIDGALLFNLALYQSKTGREKDAFATFDRLLRTEDPPEGVVEEGRALFAKVRGDSTGFGRYLAGALAERRRKRIEELASSALCWPVPDIAVTDSSGDTLRLSDLAGKVVLIDFWATWCGPCRRALPLVEEIHREYGGEKGVVVVPVNTWERPGGEERRRLVNGRWEEFGFTMPVYFDSDPGDHYSAAADRLGVTAIPATFLIGRDGKLLFKRRGFGGERSAEELRLMIEFALGRESGGAHL